MRAKGAHGKLAQVCNNLVLVSSYAVVQAKVGGNLHHVESEELAELEDS